jgi:hypothetical protein
MLTPDDLAAIREREQAATPGKWRADGGTVRECGGYYNHPIPLEGGYIDGAMLDDPQAVANAAFIAGCKTDIPALLAHIDALTAENARLNHLLVKLDTANSELLSGIVRLQNERSAAGTAST